MTELTPEHKVQLAAEIQKVSILLKRKREWIKEHTDPNHRMIPMSDVQFMLMYKYIRRLEKLLADNNISRVGETFITLNEEEHASEG
jgi:hypothetical protein